MRVYDGRRLPLGQVEVTVTDLETGKSQALPLEPSLRVRDHSPTGFEWGYAGSGPAQLALAILLDYHTVQLVAESIYQEFKFAFVAHWGDVWSIREDEIDQWVLEVVRGNCHA